MNIGVFFDKELHTFSIRNYINNILQWVNVWGVKVYGFSNRDEARDIENIVRFLWFPDCGGCVVPPREYWGLKCRFVVTFHGGAMFSLPYRVYYDSIRQAIEGTIRKYVSYIKWKTFMSKADAVITVSEYGKREFCSIFNVYEEKVIPVYHGIDFELFKPFDLSERRYFLHVSQYQPKKNVDRIVEAYRRLDTPKPELVLVVPGYRRALEDSNIRIIREPKTSHDLVKLYNGAIAFIFPSLHETFGMPILEAMACGCPVITSNTTACAEVAGDAALLVNPYSVDDIAKAMQMLLMDKRLAESLKKKGLERVKSFSWEKSARHHFEIFKRVIEQE